MMEAITIQSTKVLGEETFQLPDGREIGFKEFGDPQGAPVFFFHGSPGSRLEAGLSHDAAVENRLRVIAPERPGYGLSTFHSKLTFRTWAEDCLMLADFLEISTFGIIAISGGAPFALACAHFHPERVSFLSIVSGLGPLQGNDETLMEVPAGYRRLVSVGVRFPFLVNILFPIFLNPRFLKLAKDRPSEFLNKLTDGMNPADRAIVKNGFVGQTVIADFIASVAAGLKGLCNEFVMFLRPWSFSLSSVQVPTTIWHGTADANVPVAFAHYLKRKLKNSTLNIRHDEGHFSLAINYVDEILKDVKDHSYF